METLYSPEIRQYFRSLPWPKGLKIIIGEQEMWLQITLFKENFKSLDGVDQTHTAALVNQFGTRLSQDGVGMRLAVEEGYGP